MCKNEDDDDDDSDENDKICKKIKRTAALTVRLKYVSNKGMKIKYKKY